MKLHKLKMITESGLAELYILLLSSLLSLLLGSLLLNETLSLKRISLIKKEAKEIREVKEKIAHQLFKFDTSKFKHDSFELIALDELIYDIQVTNFFLQNSTKKRLPNWTKLLEIKNLDQCETSSLCTFLSLNISESSSTNYSVQIENDLIFENIKDQNIYLVIYGSLKIEHFLRFKNVKNSNIHIIAKDEVFIAGIEQENVENSEILIHSSLKEIEIERAHSFKQLNKSEFLLTSSTIHSRKPETWPMIRAIGDSIEKS